MIFDNIVLREELRKEEFQGLAEAEGKDDWHLRDVTGRTQIKGDEATIYLYTKALQDLVRWDSWNEKKELEAETAHNINHESLHGVIHLVMDPDDYGKFDDHFTMAAGLDIFENNSWCMDGASKKKYRKASLFGQLYVIDEDELNRKKEEAEKAWEEKQKNFDREKMDWLKDKGYD